MVTYRASQFAGTSEKFWLRLRCHSVETCVFFTSWIAARFFIELAKVVRANQAVFSFTSIV